MRKWVVGATTLAAGAISVAWWMGGRPDSAIPAPPAPAALFAQDTAATQLVRAALRAVERTPADPAAWYELGLAYEANGAADPARRCMLECVRQQPEHARGWYHLAVLEEHLGQLDAAIDGLQRSLVLDPAYVPAWWRLGDLLLDRDDLSGAERAFAESQRRFPDALRGVVGVARAKLRRGDAAGAAALLQPHAAANVPDALLHQTYAAAMSRQGLGGRDAQLPLIARTAPQALPDPWLAEANRYRADRRHRSEEATQLAAKGRFDEAISLLERLRRDEPSNPAILCNLVAAHRAKGDLRKSAAIGEEAVRLFPDSHQPYLNLAMTRMAIGAQQDGTIAPSELAIAARLVDAAIARNPSAASATACADSFIEWRVNIRRPRRATAAPPSPPQPIPTGSSSEGEASSMPACPSRPARRCGWRWRVARRAPSCCRSTPTPCTRQGDARSPTRRERGPRR